MAASGTSRGRRFAREKVAKSVWWNKHGPYPTGKNHLWPTNMLTAEANSLGNLQDYWDVFEKYPMLLGRIYLGMGGPKRFIKPIRRERNSWPMAATLANNPTMDTDA